jgi:hypothetical protein
MGVTIMAQLPIPFGQAPAKLVDSASSEKDLTIPFPCMHKACGCRSAEECWRGCCCSKPHERRDLFAKLGVSVSAAWGEPGSDARPVAASCAAGDDTCCTSGDSGVESESRNVSELESGCPFCVTAADQIAECEVPNEASLTNPTQEQTKVSTLTNQPTTVVVAHVFRCRGLGWAWGTAGVALVPPVTEAPLQDALAGMLIPLRDSIAIGERTTLDPPPPRSVAFNAA